jgi:hypothetical protein
MPRPEPLAVAHRVFQERYAEAKVLFLAGSVVRGESTAYSDLDLVVIYDRLDCAYRESFLFEGWPVEAFVHDPETLAYFFDADVAGGIPSLCNMVAEGVSIPKETDFSDAVKRRAMTRLEAGPAELTADALSRFRYAITDLLDDVRAPRSHAEAVASATRLYEQVTDFWFRSQRLWSAKGKSIPRRMRTLDPAFAERLEAAFLRLFSDGEPADVVALIEALLEPHGGCLFDGYRADAPVEWRSTPTQRSVSVSAP